MDSEYHGLKTLENHNEGEEGTTHSRTTFVKQLLIGCVVWTSYFLSGMCLGAPTVIIPQLRREINSTEQITIETVSWLSSAYNAGLIPWNILLPIFASYKGRKVPFLLVCADAFAGFLLLFLSNNTTQMFISFIILGPLHACTTTLSLLILTEYTSPEQRGMFLAAKSASYSWGIWASNAIGTFFHWKYISLFGLICSVVSLATTLFWPKSPYWLASKGRYEKCRKAHIWLKGDNIHSKRELDELIKSIQEMKSSEPLRESKLQILSNHFKLIVTKEFYKPVLLGILTLSLYHLSGKIVFSVYAIDIIKKITDSESKAYAGMLILDGITVFGMYVGCGLSRFMKRRTLLFIGSALGACFLYSLSLYLYLISLSVIVENTYVSIAILFAFSMSISCGPMILATSICGELLPLRSRSFSLIVIGSVGDIIMGIIIKMSPYIFEVFKLHGAFLFFGIATTVCSLLLYKYLPETKDKTLKEIANSMVDK